MLFMFQKTAAGSNEHSCVPVHVTVTANGASAGVAAWDTLDGIFSNLACESLQPKFWKKKAQICIVVLSSQIFEI